MAQKTDTTRPTFDSFVEALHELAKDLSVHTDPVETREPRPDGRSYEIRTIVTYLLMPHGKLQRVVINVAASP